MLWVCLSCSTAYAPAPACPHCGSTEYAEEGTEQAEMAKISVKGGPTYEGEPPAEAVEELPAAAEEPAEDAAEKPSPEEEAAEEPEAGAEEVAPLDPYDGWLVADMQAELGKRELPTSGTKPELLARLLEDDAAKG